METDEFTSALHVGEADIESADEDELFEQFSKMDTADKP